MIFFKMCNNAHIAPAGEIAEMKNISGTILGEVELPG